jgi:DNA repair exonuclease SbcCD ATPase subunit
MKLKRLILHNYKQHEDREITFDGHFIGVIGRNGSGKSNLLGALNFALAGEQPGFKKQDLLRWGSSEGHVILEFEHNSVPGRIYRELNSATATFKYGEESYSSIKKVAAGISFHLGLDKDILRQTIFVRQAEIDSILFEDPRVRELAFQKLCGIGDAAKIHKKLGEELGTLSVPPDYGEQIAEGKKRHKEMHDRLKTLRDTLSTAQTQRNTCPATHELQAALSGYEGMRGTVMRLIQVLNSEVEFAERLESAQADLVKLAVPDVDIAKIDSDLAEFRSQLEAATLYHNRVAQWKEDGRLLIELGDAPEPTPPPHSDEVIAALKEKADLTSGAIATTERDIRMYEGLAATVGNLNVTLCPVCGSEMKDAEHANKQLVRLREQLTEFRSGNEVQHYQNALTAKQQQEQVNAMRLQEWTTRSKQLQQAYNQADTLLRQTAEVKRSVAECQADVIKLEETRKAVVGSVAEHSRLSNEVKNCDEQLKRLQDEKRSLEHRITELPDLEEAYTSRSTTFEVQQQIEKRVMELTEQIAEIQTLDQQLAQLSGMVNELETNLNQLEKTLATLEHKRSMQGEYKSVIGTLTKVRDWFHYNNGPHTLASAVLTDMNKDVNEFLGQFSAPFSVVQGDGALGFKCYFHDGRAMPADGPPDAYHLSGGQRIQLAIAFRFASYCMFANTLGLLSLDEPTTHLDDYNVGAFCTLIEKVRTVAQKMDLQVLISTHERAVMPFMDTLIDLSSETVEQEQVQEYDPDSESMEAKDNE